MKTKYVLFYLGNCGETVIHENVSLCDLFSLSKRKYYASNTVKSSGMSFESYIMWREKDY